MNQCLLRLRQRFDYAPMLNFLPIGCGKGGGGGDRAVVRDGCLVLQNLNVVGEKYVYMNQCLLRRRQRFDYTPMLGYPLQT